MFSITSYSYGGQETSTLWVFYFVSHFLERSILKHSLHFLSTDQIR